MKKLLPLILLVACADPNAELLAKYKNLEIDNEYLKSQLEYKKADFERIVKIYSLQIGQCKEDLKHYVCKNKKDQTSIEFRALCGQDVIYIQSEDE